MAKCASQKAFRQPCKTTEVHYTEPLKPLDGINKDVSGAMQAMQTDYC